MMKGGDVVYEQGEWRPAPGGVFKASFEFPAPIGRQAMARYPSGEVITVPHHTRTRRISSLLTARTAAPFDAATPVLPYVLPGLALALRTPVRGVLTEPSACCPRAPSPTTAGRRGSRSSPRRAPATAHAAAWCAAPTSTG